MSTYVVSMIEVRNGGEWELLRNFRRDDYIACATDGAFPKDLTWKMTKEYVEENEEPTTIGYIENSTIFSDGRLGKDNFNLLQCLIDVNTGEYIYYPKNIT